MLSTSHFIPRTTTAVHDVKINVNALPPMVSWLDQPQHYLTGTFSLLRFLDYPSMSFSKTLTSCLSRTLIRGASPAFSSSTRLLCTSPVLRAKDPKMSDGPPKHEMQYFPNMTGAMPSENAEFRRVLWTGLYSQVVLMTVPVGGDIGDEVIAPYDCMLRYEGVLQSQRETRRPRSILESNG